MDDDGQAGGEQDDVGGGAAQGGGVVDAFRVERLELDSLVPRCLLFGDGGEDGEVDRIAALSAGGERRREQHCLRVGLRVEHRRLADGEPVLGDRAGLVGAEHVDTGQLLHRR
jgi:hypothetical protein